MSSCVSPSSSGHRCSKRFTSLTARTVFPRPIRISRECFTEDPSYPKGFDLYWSAGGTMFSLGALPSGPLVPPSATVIHTGFDAAEIGRSYPVDVPMMANVRVAAAQILDELERRNLETTAIQERRQKVVEYHHARREKLDAVCAVEMGPDADCDRALDDGDEPKNSTPMPSWSASSSPPSPSFPRTSTSITHVRSGAETSRRAAVCSAGALPPPWAPRSPPPRDKYSL